MLLTASIEPGKIVEQNFKEIQYRPYIFYLLWNGMSYEHNSNSIIISNVSFHFDTKINVLH